MQRRRRAVIDSSFRGVLYLVAGGPTNGVQDSYPWAAELIDIVTSQLKKGVQSDIYRGTRTLNMDFYL